MKNSPRVIFALLLGAFFLSACTGSGSLTTSNWPGVVATEEVVYLAYGPHVYALDAVTGNPMWKFPAEADNKVSFYAAPALASGGSELIAGGYDNVLYSLDPNSGLPSGWAFDGASNRYIGDVLVTEAGIFAPNADGHLYALGFDGRQLWQEPYPTDQAIWSGIATDGDLLFFAALDHKIHAVNSATGKSIWTQDLTTASTGTPALQNGTLFIGTYGSKIYALSTLDGSILWEFETDDWVWGSLGAADGVVYGGDISGKFYALDAATGDLLWDFTAEGGIFGGTLVLDGSVYFGTETGKFYALSTEGKTEWFYSLTGKIYGTPAFNGNSLFVGTIEGDALLTAFDLDGKALWPFSLEE